ncbi:hypothetical protein DR62_06505 [Burkholderia thailandensis]|uniref:Uncharacterized protein n=1 Tax=Burkholderia thailandensis TaxID=57975 RepID=A0AAW9CYJ2_BURTH|nr:hypothetical protein DR62_06505 [Burkholderia thailandensis]AOI52262.1 hypothetical protein WI24_10945 [Burkholderia thailandensis]AOJ51241.1 hypothetical protein AQ475_10745 [Burkholderia thailandensis]AOJ56468.1 hypothetical protein AQ477_08045 [Burkholderia thailandensis]AVR26676.1 hypothetical protein A8H32_17930 [Burkholderia thailandensis]
MRRSGRACVDAAFERQARVPPRYLHGGRDAGVAHKRRAARLLCSCGNATMRGASRASSVA